MATLDSAGGMGRSATASSTATSTYGSAGRAFRSRMRLVLSRRSVDVLEPFRRYRDSPKVAAPSGFVGQQALNIVATGVAATKGFWLMQRMEARALADLDGRTLCCHSILMRRRVPVLSRAVKFGWWRTPPSIMGRGRPFFFSTAPTVPAGTGGVSVAILRRTP